MNLFRRDRDKSKIERGTRPEQNDAFVEALGQFEEMCDRSRNDIEFAEQMTAQAEAHLTHDGSPDDETIALARVAIATAIATTAKTMMVVKYHPGLNDD